MKQRRVIWQRRKSTILKCLAKVAKEVEQTELLETAETVEVGEAVQIQALMHIIKTIVVEHKNVVAKEKK